jgi:preprotein translocase subunit SecB
MYIKDLQQAVQNNPQSKQLSQLLGVMIDLEIERTHPAHKAFLLALIRSGKVNVENLLKVFVEVKTSGALIDIECIYCKYSQFALKESAKVGLLQQQQAQQNSD